MSTEKTLATVKPGGCVQLPTSERARFEAWAEPRKHTLTRWGNSPGEVSPLFVNEVAGSYISPAAQAAWEAWQHLSAQPSPGGQGDAGRIAVEFIAAANFDVPDGYVVEEHLPGIWHYTFTDAGEKMASCASWNNKAHATIAAWQAALAARQPVGEPVAVVTTSDRFAYGKLNRDLPDGTKLYAAPPAQAVDLGKPVPLIARTLAEWHEDDGNVLWWAWCGREWAGEAAWAGTPNDSDWPGYHTHWTPHPSPPALIDSQAVGNGN